MLRAYSMLCVAAILGVVASTSSTCVVGLFSGTGTWCGLPLFWFVGFPMAIVAVTVLGIPAALIFRKLGVNHWWQFVLGATLVAIPLWYELAEPFDSARWQQSGMFDSLNYLGAGAFGGLFYWWIVMKFIDPAPVKRC